MKPVSGTEALFWSSADKILTNGFSLIISIILARLIEPSEYGIIATASIFIILLSLFVEPGMTSALIQKKHTDKLDFSTILVFNLILGLCLYALLFGLSDSISVFFELPQLSAVLRVLGIQILIGGVNSVQIAYVQRNMWFKSYFICSFVSVVIGAFIGVFLAYYGAGVWALVAYNLLRQLTNVVFTFLMFHCWFGIRFSVERFGQMFPFAARILVTKFIDQGYVEATQTIISKVYSPTELALYNKGKSFPDLVTNNLNSALTSVIFPFFSKMQDDIAILRESMRTGMKMISYVCIPIMIGLLSCSESFVKVVLTDRWIKSVPYLQLCCFYNIWIPFSNIIRQTLKSLGKGKEVLKLEIIKTSLCIISLIIFLYLVKSPLAVAMSVAFSYTVSFFIEWMIASKHLEYSVKCVLEDFVPSFFVACVMGIVVMGIGKTKIPSTVMLIVQVVGGAAVYFSLTHILHFPQEKIMISFLTRKRKEQ